MSTITLYFGGGIAGGLLLGIIGGAVVPLKQARNIENQLRLSRNVEYGRRVAVLPAAVGVLFVLVSLAVLWFTGGTVLLGGFL